MQPGHDQIMDKTNIAIIGAGPYGLSIAAHLAARNISFRIFGKPMDAWARQMPKGMKLKSEGFASSLSDPEAEFTLAEYCRQQGLPYQDNGLPVPVEMFVSYGIAFQKKFAPNVEDKLVVSIRQSAGEFELQLDDGTSLLASKVRRRCWDRAILNHSKRIVGFNVRVHDA